MIAVALLGVLAAVAMPYYGAYRNRAKIAQATQEIASMQVAIEAYVVFNRAYPQSLADVQLDTRRDPWDRAYVYYNIDANGKGHARKDHALNPLNTDYDLYSVGPDGVSKPQITQRESVDDVIRASNGNYVGLASGF